jgi:hypothetical protein
MSTRFERKVIVIISLFLFFPLSAPLLGQESSRRLFVKHIAESIKIDGILDEAVWETAESADKLWQFFPTDSVLAKQQTTIKLLYNESTIYAGIRADVAGANYVVSTLRRDFSGTSNDNVTLMFDTFKDGTNAFLFGVTPYGVQRDVFVSEGGASSTGFNTTWDMKWQAESRRHDDHYVVEIAIPFSSLKFKAGETEWRLQCYRWDLQTNEQSAWARVPQNQLLSNLAFMGTLTFEKPLGNSGTPIAIIPYSNSLAQKDFTIDKTDNKIQVGGDAKVAVGNGMNLDLTVNPDFSNVEVDDIFTNLTRFEVFLPEKRQFFIDNNDLFGNFGSPRDAIPFFSRRIGLARNASGNLIENRILGGIRLSGKLNQDWRLGFLNIQTEEDPANEIASNNNSMLALQKKFFSRSNLGLFLLNRQSVKDYAFQDSSEKYNRVVGAEYNLASADNVWSGKFYLHKSFQPDDKQGNFSSQAFLINNTRNWRLGADFVYVDAGFRSDLGFVPRLDMFKSGKSVTRHFYPQKGFINRHSFLLLSQIWWRPNLDFKKTDHDYRFSWSAGFKDQSTLELYYSNIFVFLTRNFDPTRSNAGAPLPANMSYRFNQVTGIYQSSMSKAFAFNARSTIGEFFNGNTFSFGGGLSFKMQPWALLSLALNYDGIRLPAPHADADLWLVTPKADITFSKSLFWSTLMQYSNQRNNLGVNSRLQWRFAPLSDLYLVYNDNYFTDHFSSRFRSVNLKLSYWLNI